MSCPAFIVHRSSFLRASSAPRRWQRCRHPEVYSYKELARLAGELRAAGTIVKRIEMPIPAKFLHGRSTQLDHLAVNTVLRASNTRVLAVTLAATGARAADLSEQEVTEGVVRLAASEALANETPHAVNCRIIGGASRRRAVP